MENSGKAEGISMADIDERDAMLAAIGEAWGQSRTPDDLRQRLIDWSKANEPHVDRLRAVVGPGPRTLGVVAHIRKEIVEIEDEPADMSEWADLVILALDGCWRAMIDWTNPNDVPGARTWHEVEDDILDLLFCQIDGRDTINWPDFAAIHDLLDEIERPPGTWEEDGFTRQRRPTEFLFRLVALEALLLARGLGAQYSELREAIFLKLERNMGRTWPDWRTASPDQPIEHVRSAEAGTAEAEGV